ncbi:unnamed protein product [Microthlaspi erraticum]|uniref:Uncharacterized protein n=1 Tax=Microthlaspi erraticum TaxID=1685480 RepID=A0A6D2KGR8_9BRAS|nr:unnamed protein product [Microthlaspi erraticum]
MSLASGNSQNPGTKSVKEHATEQPASASPETNPVNHRVFERKLRPKPSGRGHVCLGVTNRRPLSSKDTGRKLVSRVLPYAVGQNPS